MSARCLVCRTADDLYGSVCRPCRHIYRCEDCGTRLRHPARLCGFCEADDMPRCFFEGWGRCDGVLVRAHLIPQQLLKREFPHGVLFDEGRWRRATRYEDRYDLPHRSTSDLIADTRSWVPCCGGAQGNGGHHGQLDFSRTLRIAAHRLPAALTDFASELGLLWWIEREYSKRKDQ